MPELPRHSGGDGGLAINLKCSVRGGFLALHVSQGELPGDAGGEGDWIGLALGGWHGEF